MQTAAADILAERMARLGLPGPRRGDAVHATTASAGVQAQDIYASRLAVRSRAAGPTAADVVRACDDERTLVRTWLMRSTLHMVAAADVRWMTRLTGPMIFARHRLRRAQLGLTDDLLRAALEALPDVLAGRSLSRAEVVGELARRGVPVPTVDQGAAHLLVAAAAAGLLCRGPDRGRETTFVLLDEWVPPAASNAAVPSDDEALIELMRRYLRAFAPASVEDAAAWSGLPIRAVRRAVDSLDARTGQLDARGRPLHRLDDPPPLERGALRLLAAWGSYLMGYQHRDDLVGAGLAGLVVQGGLIRPTVVLDGRVIGHWRLRPNSAELQVELIGRSARGLTPRLRDEVRDVGRFLGRPVDLGPIGRLD